MLDDVEPGSCRVRVRLADGSRQSDWVDADLAPGWTVDGLNLVLGGPGAVSVRGRVRDEQSRAVRWAIVGVLGQSARGRTDDDGRFELLGLDPGEHLLFVQQGGFQRATTKVEIPETLEEPVSVEIVLQWARRD